MSMIARTFLQITVFGLLPNNYRSTSAEERKYVYRKTPYFFRIIIASDDVLLLDE